MIRSLLRLGEKQFEKIKRENPSLEKEYDRGENIVRMEVMQNVINQIQEGKNTRLIEMWLKKKEDWSVSSEDKSETSFSAQIAAAKKREEELSQQTADAKKREEEG